MDPAELLNFLVMRSPNVTRALSQPGLANKANGLTAVAHEELNNWLTDQLARGGGAKAGAFIGGRLGAPFGPAGIAVGAAGGAALGGISGNAIKDALWNNFITPHVYNGWNNIDVGKKLGLDNNPGELDTLLTQAFKYLDDRHPMHKVNKTIYDNVQPVARSNARNASYGVLDLLNSKTQNKEGYVPRSNLREIGMQK